MVVDAMGTLSVCIVPEACVKSHQFYWPTEVRWQNVKCHQDHKRAPISQKTLKSSKGKRSGPGDLLFGILSAIL